jgi:hypothetical protein
LRALSRLNEAFGRVAGRLTPGAARRLAGALARRVTERMPALTRARVAKPRTGIEWRIWSDFKAVLGWLGPAEAGTTAAAVARAYVEQEHQSLRTDGFAHDDGIELRSIPSVIDAALTHLPVQDLVDVLKMPTCIGRHRMAVLRALGLRAKRKFEDVWEVVAWLRQERPEVDLTIPARRLEG